MYIFYKQYFRIFNTFASYRLVFEEKNEPFFHENASNLTDEFLYDNLKRKILIKCLFKIAIKNSHGKYVEFSRQIGYFFPPKRGAQK